jgi:beta-glucosidase
MNTVTPAIEARARELRDKLTLAEKLRMLSGDQDFFDFAMTAEYSDGERHLDSAASVPRLGLGGIHFIDGPRGVTFGHSTCFPVPMARAATFDYSLEERVGEAIGREARASGANLCGAPCINLLRHPAWGRAQETYGEDSGHVGEMGAAFVRGLQRHVMGCVKHFACNSMENARLQVDVRVAPEVLDTVYLPHFERVVREGVASVMSAYNSVNGEWCGHNRTLLTTILKERWGFDGFVVSDWVCGIRDGVKAVNAGLDLEMPARLFVDDRVVKAVERGEIPMERVDDAVLRLIRQQLRFAELDEGAYGPEVIACDEHRALAREVATKAIVLLRNEVVEAKPVLPLAAPELRRLAVIGRLAAVPNTGDKGSSRVAAPYVVTPLEGLRAALAPLGGQVVHDAGEDPARAAMVAEVADAAIVVVGYDYRDEGEFMGGFPPPGFGRLLPRPSLRQLPRVVGALVSRVTGKRGAIAAGGDRASLTLHAEDEALITAVAAANKRTVVVLMCGSAVLMERWRHSVPGILILWYPGMEGGHALADVVLGSRGPTGRLPFSIPTSEDHLPPFDREATVIEYGPLHGQALLDHLGVPAAYPYGFGLTYGS